VVRDVEVVLIEEGDEGTTCDVEIGVSPCDVRIICGDDMDVVDIGAAPVEDDDPVD